MCYLNELSKKKREEKHRFPFQSPPDLKQSAVITGWGGVAGDGGVRGGTTVLKGGTSLRAVRPTLLRTRTEKVA